MIEVSTNALITIIGFALVLIGAGAAVPAAVSRANALAYKERAEQTEKQLGEVREELKDLTRDFRELKSDHDNLKDKYIRVLEENRNEMRTLIADVRVDLREMRELLSKGNAS